MYFRCLRVRSIVCVFGYLGIICVIVLELSAECCIVYVHMCKFLVVFGYFSVFVVDLGIVLHVLVGHVFVYIAVAILHSIYLWF